MEKHVALLRGVNVGGNNKIPMQLLKTAFEGAGFSQVSTYITSGNIMFSTEEKDIVALQQKCRNAIMDMFRLDIAVAVISANDLQQALARAPVWWDHDCESKHNAIFVIAPANCDFIMASVGESKPEYEQVAHYGQVIFWSAPLKTFSRTRWSKIVSTSAYNNITIRNANTAKKLAQLTKQF